MTPALQHQKLLKSLSNIFIGSHHMWVFAHFGGTFFSCRKWKKNKGKNFMQLMCCPFANLKRFSDSGDFQETLELNVGFESLRYIIDLDLFDFSSKGYYFTELYLLYFTGHQSKRGDCLYSFLPFTPSPEHWDFCSFRILDGYLLFSIAAHVIIRHLLDRSWMFNSKMDVSRMFQVSLFKYIHRWKLEFD